MSKKIAVLLSGCGHRDGAEITESVSLLISLSQAGAQVSCFAPDLNVTPVNHLTGEPLKNEKRNLLMEAARICRGQVKSLSELNPKNFDGLAIAGGMGAALYLSNWAERGAQCEVLKEVEVLIKSFFEQEKPIAAVCIAPALVARVLGAHKVTLTLGNSAETIQKIKQTGAIHVECPVDDYITDRDKKIISTPAYMYPQSRPDQIFAGIQGLSRELVEMA